MLIESPQITVGKRKIKLSKGSSKSYSICYLTLCELCEKPYTGRTVDVIHRRISGHRHCYTEILKKTAADEPTDFDKDHGLTDPNAFNQYFKFGILEVVTPGDIEKKEFKWMHKLNSFQPHGINVEYPFGIPYIGKC